MAILRALKTIRDYAIAAFGFPLLVVMCFLWGIASAVLLVVLPVRTGRRVGRVGAMAGFRAYLAIMEAVGGLRLDLSALDALRDQGPLIVAPNHPSLIDAVLVVSRLPDAMCVMKSSLVGNFLLGPAARLARYIPNDTLLGLATRAGEELRLGGHLVLFPEGTRTSRDPVGPFTAAVAVVSRRARVPRAGGLHRDRHALPGQGLVRSLAPRVPAPLSGPPRAPLRSARGRARVHGGAGALLRGGTGRAAGAAEARPAPALEGEPVEGQGSHD